MSSKQPTSVLNSIHLFNYISHRNILNIIIKKSSCVYNITYPENLTQFLWVSYNIPREFDSVLACIIKHTQKIWLSSCVYHITYTDNLTQFLWVSYNIPREFVSPKYFLANVTMDKKETSDFYWIWNICT